MKASWMRRRSEPTPTFSPMRRQSPSTWEARSVRCDRSLRAAMVDDQSRAIRVSCSSCCSRPRPASARSPLMRSTSWDSRLGETVAACAGGTVTPSSRARTSTTRAPMEVRVGAVVVTGGSAQQGTGGVDPEGIGPAGAVLDPLCGHRVAGVLPDAATLSGTPDRPAWCHATVAGASPVPHPPRSSHRVRCRVVRLVPRPRARAGPRAQRDRRRRARSRRRHRRPAGLQRGHARPRRGRRASPPASRRAASASRSWSSTTGRPTGRPRSSTSSRPRARSACCGCRATAGRGSPAGSGPNRPGARSWSGPTRT